MLSNKLNMISIILLVIVSQCAFSALYADDSEKLTIVYTEWYPYTYEENEIPKGMEIDILSHVLDSMNITYEFKKYPWNRCLLLLRTGKADALVSMLKTPEREEYSLYADENISVSEIGFFTLKSNSKTEYKSLDDFLSNDIGIIDGFSYGEEFDNAFYLKTDISRDTETLIRKVIAGRNEYGIDNMHVVAATAETMKVRNKIKFLTPPLKSMKLYVGFTKQKDYQELNKRFSDYLREFKKTEEYLRIMRKYGLID